MFLVTGERHEPFFMLQRMVKGYDRLLNIIPTDTIMFMCPPLIGTEKIAAKTYNVICKKGAKMIKVDKEMLSNFDTSESEETKDDDEEEDIHREDTLPVAITNPQEQRHEYGSIPPPSAKAKRINKISLLKRVMMINMCLCWITEK